MSVYSENLVNALQGKTKSQNGLNLPELKDKLILKFPQDVQDINRLTRKQLEMKYSKLLDTKEKSKTKSKTKRSTSSRKKSKNDITEKFRRNAHKLYTNHMSPKSLENYLKGGVDPNSFSVPAEVKGVVVDMKLPALFLAIKNKNVSNLENINLLLQYNADTNIKKEYESNQDLEKFNDAYLYKIHTGDRPLHVAIRNDSRYHKNMVETVQSLMEYGADPRIENDDGKNSFDILEDYYGENGEMRDKNPIDMTKNAYKKCISNIYRKINELLHMGYNIKG